MPGSGTSTEPLSRPPSAGTSRPARHPPGTALRRQDLRDDFPSPAFPGQVVGVAVRPQAFRPFSLSAGPDRLGLGAQPRPRGLAPPLVPQVPSACSPGRSRPRDQSPEMQPVPLPRSCRPARRLGRLLGLLLVHYACARNWFCLAATGPASPGGARVPGATALPAAAIETEVMIGTVGDARPKGTSRMTTTPRLATMASAIKFRADR